MRRSSAGSIGRSSTGGRQSIAPLRVKNDGHGSKLPKPRSSSSAGGLSYQSNRSSSGGRNSAGGNTKPRGVSVTTSGKRRSSVMRYGGHEQLKDPRPIGDKSYKEKSIKQLLEFLTENKYPHPLSPKLLHSPTTKDFVRIFEFMNSFLLPKYKVGQKYEEEIPRLLKEYGYPFTINKSAIFTVGAPHTWPTLLAALSWFREQIELMLTTNLDMLVFPPSDEEELQFEHDPLPEKKILFNYVEQCYIDFLRGCDDFDSHEEDLAKQLKAKAGKSGNIEELARENQRLQQELDMLQEQPDQLVATKDTFESLRLDVTQLSGYITNLKAHAGTQEKNLKDVEDEYEQIELEYQQILSDNKRKQHIFDTQEFSSEDVKRLNLGRADLQRQITAVEKEIEDVEKQQWTIELAISKMHNKIENKCREYNSYGHNLQLIPATAENAFGVDYELQPPRSTGTNNQHKFVSTIRPALIQVKSQCEETFSDTIEKKYSAEESLEQIVEMINERSEMQETLEAQLKRLEESIESKRELMNIECQQKQSLIEAVEQDIAALRKPSNLTLMEAEKHLIEETNRLAKLQRRRARQQKQYATFLVNAVEMIANHKSILQEESDKMRSKVEKRLEEFQKIADS